MDNKFIDFYVFYFFCKFCSRIVCSSCSKEYNLAVFKVKLAPNTFSTSLVLEADFGELSILTKRFEQIEVFFCVWKGYNRSRRLI